MNSGKTTALLQVIHNYEEKDMRVLLIKPKLDTKGEDKVVSRLGIERTVDILVSETDSITGKVKEIIEKIDAIIVDEAQFLKSKQVDELYEITKVFDIPVISYGLRCDFKMEGFEGSTRLLQIADSIEELKSVCACGKKATQSLRVLKGVPIFTGEQVAIDGMEGIKYESVCGSCYIKLKNKQK